MIGTHTSGEKMRMGRPYTTLKGLKKDDEKEVVL